MVRSPSVKNELFYHDIDIMMSPAKQFTVPQITKISLSRWPQRHASIEMMVIV